MGEDVFYVMLRGDEAALLATVIGLLAVTGAEWAGVGDAVIEGLRGRSWKVWKIQLVLRIKNGVTRDKLISRIQPGVEANVTEVEPIDWEAETAKLKEEAVTNVTLLSREVFKGLATNLKQIINPAEAIRNMRRAVAIVFWIVYHLLTGGLLQPFHMVNLLKFSDEDKYEEYRNRAGKLIVAGGGSLAYLGRAKESSTFDEVMIVAYASRLQFLRTVLKPSYWPLSLLRDESLLDGVLHAVSPAVVRS